MSKSSGKRSYSMLQKKMNELEKSKKPAIHTPMKRNTAKNETAKGNEEKKTIQPTSGKKEKKQEAVFDPNIPDRSYGDYFCSICDSHMNSDAMWEAHVTGKRHMKNVKKGDTDSKYDDLNVESLIKEEVLNVKEPVVGLQYIQEIRRREPGIPPMYNCFLCHASIATIPLVLEHVISLKHRMNFVKENSPEAFAIMDAVNLRKGQLEPLLLEECAKLEEKMGRGTVKVKQEKPKMVVTPYKRNHDKNDDDDDNDVIEIEEYRRPSKGLRTEVRPIEFQPGPSSWKSIDIPKRAPYQDDYSWRSQENDTDITYYPREYSPVKDNERSNFYRETITPDRDTSRRSYSRLSDEYARRSPDRFARRSPDKFARRSPDRFARHSDSHNRSTYARSPERDTMPSYSNAERSKDDYFPSSSRYSETHTSHSEDMYKSSSSYEKTLEVKTDVQPVPNSSTKFEGIAGALISMPTENFFNLILLKLKGGLQLNGIRELHLLTEIITEAKGVLCTHLPVDLQANLREKFSKDNIASSSMPKVSAPSPASNSSHISQVQRQSGTSSAIQYPNSYSNTAASQINELIFGARKASDLTPQNNLQTQSSNYSNNCVSSMAQPNFATISPIAPASSNYVPALSSGSYNPAPYNSNQSAAPYNSNQSAAPYNSNQSAATSVIPGLTLTENENPQQQSHVDYPPHPWSGSYQRNTDYSAYRRF